MSATEKLGGSDDDLGVGVYVQEDIMNPHDILFNQEKREAESRLGIFRGLAIAVTVICAVIVGVIILTARTARAEEIINVERLATAIGRAENSKSHPYGIMAHYKKTSPRQACINTIRHGLRDWNGRGDFIDFLQKRYAPVGVSNDPRGLNRFWAKNVKRFYYGR